MNQTQVLELSPKHDPKHSFYGKAIITVCKNVITLKSYFVDILKYNTTTKKLTFITKKADDCTATTVRHINEFIQQFCGLEKMTKKELLRMANLL